MCFKENSTWFAKLVSLFFFFALLFPSFSRNVWGTEAYATVSDKRNHLSVTEPSSTCCDSNRYTTALTIDI